MRFKFFSLLFFIINSSFYHSLTLSKSEQRFHYGEESRVVDKFFATLIRKPPISILEIEYICGGTWIHEYYVLTTAYCLTYHKDINRVGFLANNRTEWRIEEGNLYYIDRFYYPKNYILDILKAFENDIGLVKIDPKGRKPYNPLGFFPTLFNDWQNIQKIEAAPVVLFGFGRNENSVYNTRLKFMKGRLLITKEGSCTIPACTKGLSFRFEPLASKDRADSGDMGSPVYYDVDDPYHLEHKNRVIIGILSNYDLNARNIILTNVTHYIDYVNSIINK